MKRKTWDDLTPEQQAEWLRLDAALLTIEHGSVEEFFAVVAERDEFRRRHNFDLPH